MMDVMRDRSPKFEERIYMHIGSVSPHSEMRQVRLVAFPDLEESSARQSRGGIPVVNMDKGSQGLSPELKWKVRF